MKRIVALDYLRIISCILVIGIHGIWLLSPEDNYLINPLLYTVLNHIVRLGLPLFFILSSISLVSNIDILCNLKRYYLKKLCSLYFPFFAWSIYYYELSNNLLHSPMEIIINIPKACWITLTQSQYYHTWYMYALLGLILLAPFLKRMLDNLSYVELFRLCGILLIAKALNTFEIIKIGELYFGSWVIYYIFGSFFLRKESEAIYLKVIYFSIVMFIFSIYIDYYFSESVFMNNIFEYSPIMIFQVSGIFCTFIWIDKIKKMALPKIVKYLSKFTFQIYLAHPAIMNYMTHKLWFLKYGLLINHPLIFFLLIIFATFIGSVIVAALIEGIISFEIKRYISYNRIQRKMEN